jgi:hypothetical protein
MRSKIIIAVIFIGVLGVSAGFFLYNKPSEKKVTAEPAFTLEASKLFDEFNDDEGAATTKYLNQVVSVRGVVADISAVDSAGLTVMLGTSNPLFGVTCQLPDGNDGKLIERGQQISIRGLCTGKLMDVVLVKCIIEENK